MYNSDDDEFYDDSYIDDEEADISLTPPVVETRYTIVPAFDIITEMNKYIDEVNEVFKMKRSLIRRLLVHFKWNPEKLIDRYYETHDNREALFVEAGIAVSDDSKYDSQGTHATSIGKCLVCFISETDLIGMPCRHHYCKQCWNQHIKTKVMEYAITENISCMGSSCNTYLDEAFVLSTILEENVKTRYKQLIASSYVSTNKMLKWCPRAGCGNSARVTSLDVKNITCTCGMEWCFECGKPDHAPLEDCDLLKKWDKKSIDESETNKWLVLNTKECPKCKASIEKNGGCNHMKCSNDSCNHEFCWMCLGEWAPHGSDWYACNKYEENADKTAQLSKERKGMERYHHYYYRYANHRKSHEIEEAGLSTHVKNKAEHIQNKLNIPWIEAQFLDHALSVLLDCRRMLKNSYILAFYLENSPLHAIFEENQKDLEHNTEILSGLLEDHQFPTNHSDLAVYEQQVKDKFSYCETRRNLLLKDAHANYERGSWTFRSPDN